MGAGHPEASVTVDKSVPEHVYLEVAVSVVMSMPQQVYL